MMIYNLQYKKKNCFFFQGSRVVDQRKKDAFNLPTIYGERGPVVCCPFVI